MCAGGPPNPVRPMRVHSRATVASGAVAGPGCSGGVSVTGSRRTLAEAPRRMGEEAAARRQARRARAGEVRTSWARMPASATASSASRANIQGGHASRKTRRGVAATMPSGVGASTTGVTAGAARPPPLSASCGCSRPPKLNAGASATRRAVVAVTGGGCRHPRGVRLHDAGHDRLRDGRDQRPRLLASGVGETTAGLGSGLMSACAPATGSASDTPSRAQTQAVARIRLNDGRRVGRHRHAGVGRDFQQPHGRDEEPRDDRRRAR